MGRREESLGSPRSVESLPQVGGAAQLYVSNLSPLGGTGYASSLGLRSQLSNTAALFSRRHVPAVLQYK